MLIHRHLLRDVWGPAHEQDLNLLRVSVNKLRHKFESDPARPQYILTDVRVGYRLDAPPPGEDHSGAPPHRGARCSS